jgi:hypothetical protein
MSKKKMPASWKHNFPGLTGLAWIYGILSRIDGKSNQEPQGVLCKRIPDCRFFNLPRWGYGK